MILEFQGKSYSGFIDTSKIECISICKNSLYVNFILFGKDHYVEFVSVVDADNFYNKLKDAFLGKNNETNL